MDLKKEFLPYWTYGFIGIVYFSIAGLTTLFLAGFSAGFFGQLIHGGYDHPHAIIYILPVLAVAPFFTGYLFKQIFSNNKD